MIAEIKKMLKNYMFFGSLDQVVFKVKQRSSVYSNEKNSKRVELLIWYDFFSFLFKSVFFEYLQIQDLT